MEKEKSVLKIYFEGYETKPIKYDFNEGKLYGVSGKAIKQLANKFKDIWLGDKATYLEECIYKDIQEYTASNTYTISRLAISEQYWEYRDILNCIPSFKDNKIPKGYIKYCRENNLKIDPNSADKFVIYQKMSSNFSNAEVQAINDMLNSGFYLSTMKTILGYDTGYVKAMLHIWTKAGTTPSSWRRLLDTTYRYQQHYKEYFDTSRGADHNLKLFNAWKEVFDIQALTLQQMRIKSIETLETENLCVKVPTTTAEFTDEGKQQSNCVGYHYHNSIKEGRDLIYFIRRKDNPDKSYITCRFTCDRYGRGYYSPECRTFGNGWCVDDELETAELINKIDAAIINILKRESREEK